LGIVAKQAYANTLNVVIGVVIGAINTIFILPHAFESLPGEWGLVRTLFAYSIIFGQIFGFGTYNIIVKEYVNQQSQIIKRAILGLSLLLGLTGLLLLIGIVYFLENWMAIIVDEQDVVMIYANLGILFTLSGVFIFNQTFTGFIVSNHKTPVVQFVNDVFLKFTYLILALVYWLNPFSFDLYLNLIVGTYIISLLIYVGYAISIGFKFNLKLKLLKVKELIIYGGVTILDRGAGILVNNLDLIMIGLILDLENVAYYILAFYIGTVINIPNKAIMAPAYPHVSSLVKNENKEGLDKLYKQTSLNQLIAGGVLFLLVWVNIDAIYQLIPEKFSGGIWVVFFIGLSKIFNLATGVSGVIIIFSKYYRMNLVFNSILIVLTIITNYFLIIKYGINGAAIATAITVFIYNLLKVSYVKWRFNTLPFNNSTIKTVIIFAVVGFLGTLIDFKNLGPFLSIAIKSGIIIIMLAIGFYGLNVKAEILDLPKELIKRYNKRAN
jgi:O-antigen/teichoic acid export membrane protein